MDSSFPTPTQSGDIFSFPDEVLSSKLEFIQEVGFGNWGSVWLCRPKSSSGKHKPKIAVKLVHRAKKDKATAATTAARVRSLWNEMKVVRSLKADSHPSIIQFHSFIITPQYALITMPYLPSLVPVEVEEPIAKDWFKSLLSGVQHLHRNGVVHNDIKPANIMLTYDRVPVLVDFGFAEKYDTSSSRAFQSTMAYGTPEYLSPERARGTLHDTRKSDVWALGITFFEILVGRTPFEYTEGEAFATEEDLHRYWARTLRGKWVGSYKMSTAMEKMLRRMTIPNADLRCTAVEAMDDPYWQLGDVIVHKRSASKTHSRSSSLLFDAELSKLVDMLPPWTIRPNKAKHVKEPPTATNLANVNKENNPKPQQSQRHSRSHSQPFAAVSNARLQPKKRAPGGGLSPIKASPCNTPRKVVGTRAPLSARHAQNVRNANHDENGSANKIPKHGDSYRKGRVFMDLTGLNKRNLETGDKVDTSKVELNVGSLGNTSKDANLSASVRNRVKDWERERERLREMERLEELEKAREEEAVESEVPALLTRQVSLARSASLMSVREGRQHGGIMPYVPISVAISQEFVTSDTPPVLPPLGDSGLLRSLKMSIDRGMRFYKFSTIGQSRPTLTSYDDAEGRVEVSARPSWEDDELDRQVSPVARSALRTEQFMADSREDRMNIWMQNVEKVVEEARQNFASNSAASSPPPPLPLAPLSRSTSQSRRSSRLPRKVLAASQIFANHPEDASVIAKDNDNSSYFNVSVPAPEASSPVVTPVVHVQAATPTRPRRATVSELRSPADPTPPRPSLDILDTGSPSKRREKSKSQGFHLQQHIRPISRLEFEIEQESRPLPSPRLSAMIDRSLFVAPPREDSSLPSITVFSDELNASPIHVQTYPVRSTSSQLPLPDSPGQRRIEGMLASSGVKRMGQGYSSTMTGIARPPPPVSTYKRNPRAFYSTRRPMAPPVSSSPGNSKALSVDELGVFSRGGPSPTVPKEDTLVKRAFKRLSRAVT